jgi:hypothetical protein
MLRYSWYQRKEGQADLQHIEFIADDHAIIRFSGEPAKVSRLTVTRVKKEDLKTSRVIPVPLKKQAKLL